MKRTFKIEVKVHSCDLTFAEGMGPGVLAHQTLTFDLPDDFDETRLMTQIRDYGRDLTDFAVGVVVTEVQA